MRYENAVRFCPQTARPFEQSFLICVAAHARELDDVRVHMNLFLEQFHFLRASDQRPSQRADGLIADEENRTLLPPEVVLQMMLDSSCIAHALADMMTFGVSLKLMAFDSSDVIESFKPGNRIGLMPCARSAAASES